MSAANAASASAFQNAIASFKVKSKISQAAFNELQATTLQDLKETITAIEQKQKSTRTLRSLNRIKPFLEGMETYGKVVDVFLNVSSIVSFIWGPVKFILVTASSITDAFNAVLHAYQDIGESLLQYLEYESYIKKYPKLISSLEVVFEDILSFHAEAVKYFKCKIWAKLFEATWGGFGSKIRQLTSQIALHQRSLEVNLKLVQFGELQEMHCELRQVRSEEVRHFEDLRKEIHEARRELQEAREKANIAEEKAEEDLKAKTLQYRVIINQWLDTEGSDSEVRQEYLAKCRFDGTGEWIFRQQEFQKWYDPVTCENDLLWLHGIPGAGKSVLSSLIVEKAAREPEVQVLFFYCQHRDENRNGLLLLACDMLRQAISKSPDLLMYVHQSMNESSKVRLSKQSHAVELLKIALEAFQKTYVVIDGLDEYSRNSRKEICDFFINYVKAVPKSKMGSLRCIFISRHDGPAKKDLGLLSSIKIDTEDNEPDIRAYCASKHREIKAKFPQLDPMKQNITFEVTKRAKGMFLFAKLVCENLLCQKTFAKLLVELDPEVFPQGLEEAYKRVVDRLLKETTRAQSEDVEKLLGWLTCARRPLRWFEIQGAMAVDNAEMDYDDSQKLSGEYESAEDCRSHCDSLVETYPNQTVNLVHVTAKHFLLAGGYLDRLKIELDMSTLCLGYLSSDPMNPDTSANDISEHFRNGFYAFLDYAVSFWALHLEYGLSKADTANTGLSRSVELTVESVENFLQTHWKAPKKEQIVPQTLKDNLRELNRTSSYEQACQAVFQAKSRLRSADRGCGADEAFHMYPLVALVRQTMEDLRGSASLTKGDRDKLDALYGLNWFKCDHLDCRFFYEGFPKKEQRNEHKLKHERAFVCDVEGCPEATVGCTSAKKLERHKTTCHSVQFPPETEAKIHEIGSKSKPNTTETSNLSVPPVPPPDEATSNDVDAQGDALAQDQVSTQDQISTQEQMPARERETKSPGVEEMGDEEITEESLKANFIEPQIPIASMEVGVVRPASDPNVCQICLKKFKAKFNLNVHIRSHSNVRDFSCPECGKGFPRKNTLHRHMETHSGQRQWVCQIDRIEGVQTGCGQRFSRRDALVKHRKTCMQTLDSSQVQQQSAQDQLLPNAI